MKISKPCLAGAFAALSLAPALCAQAPEFKTLAGFESLSNWELSASFPLSLEGGSDGTAVVEWPKEAKPGEKLSATFKLKSPVRLSSNAARAGLWLFVEKPLPLTGLWLLFQDANGEGVEYALPVPESWAVGWQYIDSFPFDANELGRLHPSVGAMLSGKPGMPKLPLALLGLKFEGKPGYGKCYLKSLEESFYDLGSKGYFWALSMPGERYWMEQTYMRSGEPPHMLASQIMPSGGSCDLHWEIERSFQGALISSHEAKLSFQSGDLAAQARKLPLGDLGTGVYKVTVSQTPESLEGVAPDAWTRQVRDARGRALWDLDAGRRVLRCVKEAPQGTLCWRQTLKIPGPGVCKLAFSSKGSTAQEARVVPLDRAFKNVGEPLKFSVPPSAEWRSSEFSVSLPPEAEQAFLELGAGGPGEACFSSASLLREGLELAANGSFVNGSALKQRVFELKVFNSPVVLKERKGSEYCVDAGGSLSVPLPSWREKPGAKAWRISASSGEQVACGELPAAESLSWTPPSPGAYAFVAERSLDGIVVDRCSRSLGCKTPQGPGEDAPKDSGARTPREEDFFGPGKSYFTWAMYENHPEEPGYFNDMKAWISDGRAAGFDLFRIRVDWAKVEPLPGVFDYSVTDRLLEEVARQGGKSVLELRFEAPEWLYWTPQLDSRGRPDVWRHGKAERIPSIWSAGMLDSITRFVERSVKRYRNRADLAGYHVWGLPGSMDWTSVDKPWLGQRVDYSPAAVGAFCKFTKGRFGFPAPQASPDWSKPDLTEAWRAWIEFRAWSLDSFFIDHVVAPIRALDAERPLIGYFGLDYASPRLAESSRSLNWRRHTGGCELYYQIPLQAMRAISDTGKTWPQEVHLMTPVPAGLEQATFQISAPGGEAFHWNCYWRSNIRVGAWTPDREAGLAEWKSLWRPLWQEMRDASLAERPEVAAVAAWSSMHYALRSFFCLRLGDYATATAAALDRDQLHAAWFSENSTLEGLGRYKLIVVPPGAAQVMPARIADALAAYAENGGCILLFPNSGQWVVEEPENRNALLKRLGWRSPDSAGALDAVDLGNSGLPASQRDGAKAEARASARSSILPPGLSFALNRPEPLSVPEGASTEALCSDGSPALLSWRFGKGRVARFAGVPDWQKSPGMMAAFAKWAGCSPEAGSDAPSIQLRHLLKGDVHYLIVHRLPDSSRAQWPPSMDRDELRKASPPLAAKCKVPNLPQGLWLVSELTAPGSEPRKIDSESIASGIQVELFLSQTKVFKLEPLAK